MNSRKIGKQAEQKIIDILKNNRNRLPPWMIGPFVSASTEDDKKGIDIWVGTDIGDLPLQVKSRHCSKRKPSFYRNKSIGYVNLRGAKRGILKSNKELFGNVIKELKILRQKRKNLLEKTVEYDNVVLSQQ